VTGRGPHDSQSDPEPKVRERAHIDDFKQSLRKVQRCSLLFLPHH
jgi:hypothetical protein